MHIINLALNALGFVWAFCVSVVKQHNIVEEKVHRVATTWTTQMLKEPLQRAALDISLGAGLSRV
jgi:hypothetical protein